MKTEEMTPSHPLFDLLLSTDNAVPLLEAGNALREIVLASRQFGGTGKLTITVNFKTEFGRGTPQTKVAVAVSKQVPKVPLGISTFFASEAGELLRDDPAQLELELGERKTIQLAGRRGAAAKAAPSQAAGQ